MPRVLSSTRAVHSLPCRKVIVPSALQVLGETASSSSLEQSPSLSKPHWKESNSFVIHKNAPGTGNICVARIAVFWANIWPLHAHYSFNFWSWCLSLVEPLMSLHTSASGLVQCWGFSGSQYKGEWSDPACPWRVSLRSCAGDLGSSCLGVLCKYGSSWKMKPCSSSRLSILELFFPVSSSR